MIIELFPGNRKIIDVIITDNQKQPVLNLAPVGDLLKSDKTPAGIAGFSGMVFSNPSSNLYSLTTPVVPNDATLYGIYWLRVTAPGTDLQSDLKVRILLREQT